MPYISNYILERVNWGKP